MEIQEDKIETVKAPITFAKSAIPAIDKHWRNKNFKSRTDYVNYLVRKDMENHYGQIQQQPAVSE